MAIATISKVGYIDFEFTREGGGQLRPTELGLTWWKSVQHLDCIYQSYPRTKKLAQVRKDIVQAIAQSPVNTLVFWDRTQDSEILKQSGLNLRKYNLIDLQFELGKTTLKSVSEQHHINCQTIKPYLLPKHQGKFKVKLHSATGDALRVALLHRLYVEQSDNNQTTTANVKINKAKPISQNAQLFQYFETLDLTPLVIQRRVSQKTALTLWKSAVLDNPHLNIPYDSFLVILKAHLFSLI